MGDNLFEGSIDLNELANSEEAILNLADVEVEEDQEDVAGAPVNDNKEDKTSNDKQADEDEGFDPDFLANLGAEEEDNEDAASEGEKNIKKTPADKETSPSSDSDTLTSLASALREAGVFSSLEDEDLEEVKDVDALLKAIEKQIKHNEFAGLNEDQKEYLEALKDGVPVEEYSKAKASVAQYENLQDKLIDENINVQYELIRRSLIVDGVGAERADKLAKLAVKEETAAQDAKLAKNALIQYEKGLIEEKREELRRSKEEQEVAAQKALEDLKSKINETSEILPGLKVNSNTKTKIFESITNPTKLDEQGNPSNEVMESYKEPEYKMRLHALHVITKGFTDFSKFEKTTKTKAVQEFEEKLKTGSVVRSGSAGVKGSTTLGMVDALGSYIPPHLRNK